MARSKKSFNGSNEENWPRRRTSPCTRLWQVSIGVLRRFPVPIPPAAEQAEIVVLLDEELSQIDAAETTITHGLLRAARLRQGILKQAFEGKLVPQEPKDEPASVLLERIRADSQRVSYD
jgi:type I restriction enzyme, S subunit